MAQNHVLSNVSCCVSRSQNSTCSSESPLIEDAKIGIGLICSSILPEKIYKMFLPKKFGFIDVLRTVCHHESD